MPSKQVTDRQKAAILVISSAQRNEAVIAEKLQALFGVEPAATRGLVSGLAATIERELGTVVDADHAYLAELGDDDPVRLGRDRHAELLQQDLTLLRETVAAAFGEEAVGGLGFAGRTPQDPVQLHNLATLVLKRLPEWQPPAPRIEDIQFRPERWTARLAPTHASLGGALQAVARERREADEALVAKNRALEGYDRTFSVAANLLSGLLEAAGESDLARRVRPSRRSPGRTLETESVVDPAAP